MSKLRQSEVRAHMAQKEAEDKVQKLNVEISRLQSEAARAKSSQSNKVNPSDLDNEREEIIHQLSMSVQEVRIFSSLNPEAFSQNQNA